LHAEAGRVITLYQFSSSPFTEKVRRALNYKGLAFQTHEVVRVTVESGAYDHVSATRKFPVLTDGEATVCDSTDILIHLDAVYPDRPIRPTEPRQAAWAHVIEDWADESLYFYEILLRAAWEHNLDAALEVFAKSLPHVPPDQLKAAILAQATSLLQTQGLGRKPVEQVKADVVRHFSALDAMLEGREWLVADHPASADFAVAGQVGALMFAEEARAALSRTRNVEAWRARLDDVAPVHREEAR
jgi:glutathione S-transferase